MDNFTTMLHATDLPTKVCGSDWRTLGLKFNQGHIFWIVTQLFQVYVESEFQLLLLMKSP